MLFLSAKEKAYIKAHLTHVNHTTFNPEHPGVVRIHLIPPKDWKKPSVPYLVILNGQDILPITLSWAVLLSAFMEQLNTYDGSTVPEDAYAEIVHATVQKVRAVYHVKEQTLKNDLDRMLSAFTAIARGETPNEDIGALSIFEYAPHMRAPHRVDLMVSAMTDERGAWHCNQRCTHCYAAGQALSCARELDTKSWKHVMDTLKQACVAQLTFTGGEPTMREDLPELVDHARFFITRLNTNGILLSKDLCDRLFHASLDSVQVTLYSMDENVHNTLVGAPRLNDTLQGIDNAIASGLSVSINTPLCTLNRDYVPTLKAMVARGVRYFSCSGLIKTGNALTDASQTTALDAQELNDILRDAFAYCKQADVELQFTSPGCLSDEALRQAGATLIPSCGACLTNMAVAPDGEVIPCQSWLGEGLGNITNTPFDAIWDSARCREIRNVSARAEHICQLKKEKEEAQ